MPSLLDNDLSNSFKVIYAGIPFITDKATVFRSPGHTPHGQEGAERNAPPRDQQPLADLIDEIDRLIPFNYLQDFSPASDYPGRNLGAIARKMFQGPFPNPKIRIGDWYYPNGASRWSVFRGLATSTQVKGMMKQTAGHVAATFTMYQNPFSPSNPNFGNSVSVVNYTLTSKMYMLPPRPLGETAGKFDGLYLVTLVDERYYWQRIPVSLAGSLRLDSWNATDWLTLINNVLNTLGVGPADASQLPPTYAASGPELDSQLWTNFEPASIVLDALCANIGRTLVRSLEGTYSVLMPGESAATVTANRGLATRVFRTAGGDMFVPSGSLLPVGGLSQSPNSVIPANVTVSFPKYVAGLDPVPHFANPRYINQRPSAWYEESYGDTASVTVPIANAGPQIWSSGALAVGNGALSGSFISGETFLSGLVGIFSYNHVIHDTAKAMYLAESALGGTPANASGLTALAQQIAQDFYAGQVAAALDETYPGTFAWTPEGLHDIVWTYSERARGAFTRIVRTQWNNFVEELQHATPPDLPVLLTNTSNPQGVGGTSVAQAWRDSFSGTIFTPVLASGNASPGLGFNGTAVGSGDMFVRFADISYFPTQNRWRGFIDNEEFLFEGTSGGIEVGVVGTVFCCPCSEYTFITSGLLSCCGIIDGSFVSLNFQSGLSTGPAGQCFWKGTVSGGMGGGGNLDATLTYIANSGPSSLSLSMGQTIGGTGNFKPLSGALLNCNQLSLFLTNSLGVVLPPVLVTLNCSPSSIPLPPAGTPSGTPATVASGPASGGYRVDVVYRGIDGTIPVSHNSGAAVFWDISDRTFGVNLVTQEKMHWAFPHEWTSGGIMGVREVPVLQSIQIFENTGTVLNGIVHYSGAVNRYDTTKTSGAAFIQEELIWAVERESLVPVSGSIIGGQFAGFSKIPHTAPVYLFDAGGACPCTSGGTGGNDTPKCCDCKEFDFSITGLDPTTCGGNGSYALSSKNSCNCCMWCTPPSTAPGGGEACLTMKPGPAGSIGVLEICTALNCCATYRGIVSDCNNFTLNLCDTCGAGASGWPGSITITCGCVPGVCSFCTTEAGAPGSFTVNVPAGFFTTSPLSLFNNTNWTLKSKTPCIWNQCQTDPTTNDILCMTLTILGPGNTTLLLQVFSPSGTGAPLASITFLDTTDPANGDCCSNNFNFSGATGAGGCCTCSQFSIIAEILSCTSSSIIYSEGVLVTGPSAGPSSNCCWTGTSAKGNVYTLCQSAGGGTNWTLTVSVVSPSSCTEIFRGSVPPGQNCNQGIFFLTNDRGNAIADIECKIATGGGGGSGTGTLTAIPVCCGVQQVSTPCCPNNKINKKLHATVVLDNAQLCPQFQGFVVTLNWFKGGTGPCPDFAGSLHPDYWFGFAPATGDTNLVILMYCDTVSGAPTWKLAGECTSSPPDCQFFSNSFVTGSFTAPSQPANCSIPTFVFDFASIGASCCGAFGGTGSIKVTD